MIYEGARGKTRAIYGLVAALVILTPLGLLATGTAWGEWGIDELSTVISDGKALGYVPEGMKNGFSVEAIMPDYVINGLPDTAGYVLSAAAGAAILIIMFKVLSSLKGGENKR